jgi:hypothetical protein
MEQIVNTPFDSIVSAYGSYSEAQGQVKKADGTVFSDSNYSKFSRTAACTNVYVSQESGAAPSKFIRATVQVYYGGRLIAVIDRLITE